MSQRRSRSLLAGLVAAAALLLAAAGGWQAAAPPGVVTTHERAAALEHNLRCPTCQGLSIADSPSPIAAGMRQQVETQLATGASTAQVRAYFTARYSDWILLDPPRRGVGLLVWAFPPLLLLAGGLLLRRTLRRRAFSTANTAEELTAAAMFAAEPPPELALPEPVAAALTDLRAARVEADLEPAGQASVDDAMGRLAAAVHAHPVSAAALAAPSPEVHPPPANVPARDTPRPRRNRRYAPLVAAAVFAGLLGATLTRAIGSRPTGAVPTGTFVTTPAGTPQPAVPASAPATIPILTGLQQATRAHPTDPGLWLAYATALDHAGRLTDAEPAYRTTLALDPSSTPAHEQLAWLLTRGGSPTQALSLLAPLTQQRPDDPQVVLLVGVAQRGAGQPQAGATLRRYLRLAPNSVQAPYVQSLLRSSP